LTLEHTEKDPKTRLQEYLQSLRKTLPLYEVVSTVGEAHDQTFHVICRLPDMAMHTEGVGLSRRYAEQEAARQALVILEASK
jgi:ribonuclease-3